LLKYLAVVRRNFIGASRKIQHKPHRIMNDLSSKR
jgi:hypothetical protein